MGIRWSGSLFVGFTHRPMAQLVSGHTEVAPLVWTAPGDTNMNTCHHPSPPSHHMGCHLVSAILRGGSGRLDSFCQFISGAWRNADYAAVCRVVSLSQYTPSGVWPSSA